MKTKKQLLQEFEEVWGVQGFTRDTYLKPKVKDLFIQAIDATEQRVRGEKAEQCFCKSYYDDDNDLQDCTCGKCSTTNKKRKDTRKGVGLKDWKIGTEEW